MGATDAEKIREGQERLEWLQERSARRALIPVGGHDFSRLVGDGPRPYKLFVWITSNSGSCSLCNELRPEVDLLSDQFEAARYPGEAEGADMEHRVFFLELDGSKHYQFFQELGVQYIPHLYYIPPTKLSKRKPWPRALKDEIKMQPGWKAEDMERNIRSRTKITLDIERPPEPVNWASVAMTVLAIVGGIAFFSSDASVPVVRFLRSPMVMLAVSFLFYGFCISGGMYNRIRNTPWADQNGNIIAPGSRGQFGGESVMVCVLQIVLAASVVLLNTTVHSYKMPASQRNIFALMVLGFFVYVWRQMLGIYTIKNPHFRMGWVWHMR